MSKGATNWGKALHIHPAAAAAVCTVEAFTSAADDATATLSKHSPEFEWANNF